MLKGKKNLNLTHCIQTIMMDWLFMSFEKLKQCRATNIYDVEGSGPEVDG